MSCINNLIQYLNNVDNLHIPTLADSKFFINYDNYLLINDNITLKSGHTIQKNTKWSDIGDKPNNNQSKPSFTFMLFLILVLLCDYSHDHIKDLARGGNNNSKFGKTTTLKYVAYIYVYTIISMFMVTCFNYTTTAQEEYKIIDFFYLISHLDTTIPAAKILIGLFNIINKYISKLYIDHSINISSKSSQTIQKYILTDLILRYIPRLFNYSKCTHYSQFNATDFEDECFIYLFNKIKENGLIKNMKLPSQFNRSFFINNAFTKFKQLGVLMNISDIEIHKINTISTLVDSQTDTLTPIIAVERFIIDGIDTNTDTFISMVKKLENNSTITNANFFGNNDDNAYIKTNCSTKLQDFKNFKNDNFQNLCGKKISLSGQYNLFPLNLKFIIEKDIHKNNFITYSQNIDDIDTLIEYTKYSKIVDKQRYKLFTMKLKKKLKITRNVSIKYCGEEIYNNKDEFDFSNIKNKTTQRNVQNELISDFDKVFINSTMNNLQNYVKIELDKGSDIFKTFIKKTFPKTLGDLCQMFDSSCPDIVNILAGNNNGQILNTDEKINRILFANNDLTASIIYMFFCFGSKMSQNSGMLEPYMSSNYIIPPSPSHTMFTPLTTSTAQSAGTLNISSDLEAENYIMQRDIINSYHNIELYDDLYIEYLKIKIDNIIDKMKNHLLINLDLYFINYLDDFRFYSIGPTELNTYINYCINMITLESIYNMIFIKNNTEFTITRNHIKRLMSSRRIENNDENRHILKYINYINNICLRIDKIIERNIKFFIFLNNYLPKTNSYQIPNENNINDIIDKLNENIIDLNNLETNLVRNRIISSISENDKEMYIAFDIVNNTDIFERRGTTKNNTRKNKKVKKINTKKKKRKT